MKSPSRPFLVKGTWLSCSVSQTRMIARSLAKAIDKRPTTIALVGPLGAGKTYFSKYFCQAMGVPKDRITSATFVYKNEYQAGVKIIHADWYRWEALSSDQLLEWQEDLEKPCVRLVEWADKFQELLPKDFIRVSFHYGPDQSRKINVKFVGSTKKIERDFVRAMKIS